MSIERLAIAASALLLAGCSAGPATVSQDTVTTTAPSAAPSEDWRVAEAGVLRDHVQLTFADRFSKAGESYFSPDDRKIIFQAIETVPDGETPEAFYQMYVADLVRENGRVTGIGPVLRLSPPGSANTCGWFHPTKPDTVIFGSTIIPPVDPGKSGYQRGKSRYVWQFPKEMTIVECDLRRADGTANTLTPIVADPTAYLAECALSPDGRHLVYCKRVETDGSIGGDLIVRDLHTGRDVVVAGNDGYDGGPFFSPDGRRICYRSDRMGNDLLQIFVGELAFGPDGGVVGIEREFQLTDNGHVNWAPFWHPEGRHLVYASSAMGHHNYEVFATDADAGGAGGTTRYGTRTRRLTHAPGFDGLPVFNSDGSLMMWTGQRDAGRTSQVWLARFVMDPDAPETGAH